MALALHGADQPVELAAVQQQLAGPGKLFAAAELDGNIVKLSTTGEFKPEWMERALSMGKLIGMTNLAPAAEIFTTRFKPVPTT